VREHLHLPTAADSSHQRQFTNSNRQQASMLASPPTQGESFAFSHHSTFPLTPLSQLSSLH